MIRAIKKVFVLIVIALFLPVSVLAADNAPWYEKMLVGMEVGPTGAHFGHSDPEDVRYCSIFSGTDIVKHCADANSEYLVMWVRDGDYAYYNSEMLPKAPGLGNRDPLQEAMDEAAKHNMPVIAYCVVQQGGHFLKAHPEFEMRDVNDTPIGRFCYNSGYLESMKAIVEEQLAYGIDGFHIDMVDQGFGPPYGCFCDTCKAMFEKEYGHPLPSGVTWDSTWDDFLQFRYDTSERFMTALYDYIKSINPKATVDFNYHGNPPFAFELGQRPVQHANNADFVTGETGVWGFSALTVGLNVGFYRAATPGYPVQVAMQRGVRMYHDQTTRPLADIRWELLSLLAHGAFVTIVDKTGFDGWLDPVTYERIGQAFKEVEDKKAHFGQEILADVGLYYCHRTRDWVGRENPGEYFSVFQGAHKAMVYDHIPWGVVFDENMSMEVLQRFPVIVLPNVGIVTEEQASLFKTYVEEGGNLIITGMTGCYDFMGNRTSQSALEEIVGATLAGVLDSQDNWVSLSEDTPEVLCGETPVDWPFLVKGPAVIYEAKDAKAYGRLMKPYRSTRQLEGKEGTGWPMSADEPVGPAVLVNKIGKGSVVTYAVSPGYAAASDHHIVEARNLLANAVHFLLPDPRVQIVAPCTVQSVVSDDPESRTLRIHLLGYNAPPQTTPAANRPYVLPALIEDAPMYRFKIECTDSIREVDTLNETTIYNKEGNVVSGTINDIHEAVLIRY